MILATFGPAQLVVILFALLIGIGIGVLYLLTLQNTLKQVDESNRKVAPANVWLMFIPLFNLVYAFILYPQICDSIKAEYRYRGLNESGDFGRSLGVTMPVLSLCGIVPFIGSLAGIANFIIWIVFWSKMGGYKSKLQSTPKGEGIGAMAGIGSSTDLLDN